MEENPMGNFRLAGTGKQRVAKPKRDNTKARANKLTREGSFLATMLAITKKAPTGALQKNTNATKNKQNQKKSSISASSLPPF